MERDFMGKSASRRPAEGVVAVATLAIVVAVSYIACAQGVAINRKTVVLEMSWKRGDANFIRLESACLNNSDSGCFCSNDFTLTRSKEFADYIESFGAKTVPVKYGVDYDPNHEVVGAVLESVGDWPAERFNVAERSLGSGFRSQKQATGTVVRHHGRNPADCFPKSAN
jgi:hypothetical protein